MLCQTFFSSDEKKEKNPTRTFKYYDIFINGLLKPGKFIKKQVIKTFLCSGCELSTSLGGTQRVLSLQSN